MIASKLSIAAKTLRKVGFFTESESTAFQDSLGKAKIGCLRIVEGVGYDTHDFSRDRDSHCQASQTNTPFRGASNSGFRTN
jgi:hypothetical protein